jgi:hypothetical protein
MQRCLNVEIHVAAVRLILPLAVLVAGLGHSHITQASVAGPRCYVDASGQSPGGGFDWSDAYTDLQSALSNDSCTEIWVAAGTYLPDGASPGDRSLSFVLKSGVAIYGGFSGDELLITKKALKTSEAQKRRT